MQNGFSTVSGSTVENRLALFLSERYGLAVCSLRAAPRGFFGETWRVEAPGGPYFLKLDRWAYHRPVFRRGLLAADRLLGAGLDFLAPLIRGTDGALWYSFEDGDLALFGFAEGEHTEDYPLGELFSRLARAYRVKADDLPLPREDFTPRALLRFEKNAAALDESTPDGALALSLFRENAALLGQIRDRVLVFSEVCRRGDPGPVVLTHGDAGGNCIVGPDRFTVIDWDEAMLAPPERDAWFFMHRESQTRAIEEALARGGFPYRLRRERFAFYCYASVFYYLSEYLEALACGKEEQKPAIREKFRGFFTSWIRTQLAAAGLVSPSP